MKKLSSSGETIVEVIISVAVVGAVLAGAYYLIDRSYKQNQAAVERVAGLKAAESKLETLRTFSSDILDPFTGTACVSSSGFDTLNLDTDPDCKVDRYKVTVTKDANGTFAIRSEWDSLLQDKENLTLYYRP